MTRARWYNVIQIIDILVLSELFNVALGLAFHGSDAAKLREVINLLAMGTYGALWGFRNHAQARDAGKYPVPAWRPSR